MYDKVLVPMALNHDISSETLKLAKTLCNEGGEITALHVYEMLPSMARVYMGEEAVKAGFEKAKALLHEKTKDIQGVTAVIMEGHPYRMISDYAVDNGFGCIVIASHKPEFSDYFLGSTAAKVVRHAKCAVMVYR